MCKKNAAFLYINNELTDREIKKTVPGTMSIKRIKCLGINLINKVKDQYTKIIIMLCKKFKNI